MVEWFSENIIEQILKPIWDFLINTLSGITEVVFGALFGMNFKEIVDKFQTDAVAFFVDLIWQRLATWVNNLLHGLFVIVLFALDIIAAGFNIISGTDKMQVRTKWGYWEEKYLIDYLFDGGGVSRAFLGVMLIGIILCFALTIFYVMKSMLDIDNKRPVGKVLGQTLHAMLIYLLLPFIVVSGIKLSSVVINKSADVMTLGADNVSMGTYIYFSVIQDAARGHVPTVAEAAAEQVMGYLTKGPFAAFESRLKMMYMAADRTADLANTLAETGDVPDYMYFPELRKLEAEVGSGDPLKKRVLEEFLSGRGSPFAEALGFGSMPYLNIYYSAQLLKHERVHSVIGLVSSAAVLVFMFMATWVAVKKLFEIVLLYIISPVFIASLPMDDGELFGKWKDMFISRICLGFGIVISIRLFLLMIPVLFSRNIILAQLGILDSVLRLIILISMIASVVKAHTLVTKVIEAGGSARGGPDHEGDASAKGMAGLMAGVNLAKKAPAAAKKGFETISQAQGGGNKTFTGAKQSLAGGKSGGRETSGEKSTNSKTSADRTDKSKASPPENEKKDEHNDEYKE